MRHEVDGGQSRCSCRGWWCKICGASNKIVAFHNNLMKLWVTKQTIRDQLTFINAQLGKIDDYTLYEFLVGEITQEQYDEAVANFDPYVKPKKQVKVSVKEFKPTVNPEKQCVYDWPGVWERCIHCNSIRKYMQGKECPMYNENDNKK